MLKGVKDAIVGLGKAVANEPTFKTITIAIKEIRIVAIIIFVVITTDRDDFTIKTRNSAREDHFLIISSSASRVVHEMLKEISFEELEKDRNFSCILKSFNYLRDVAVTMKDKVLR